MMRSCVWRSPIYITSFIKFTRILKLTYATKYVSGFILSFIPISTRVCDEL
ncbi:hypothetical protein Hanom_Chr03g00234791 [Helianthus anomalus]